ncbi:MAG: hypothetical protein JRE23_13655, partial [Deltaproteobacteria bacterium]|nr:hypothetical protein [Deltaproteobacteria bacterium]
MGVFNKTIAQEDRNYLVKVSSNDEVADYLESKLVAGTGVEITKEGTGDNEKLRIDYDATSATNPNNKVAVDVTKTPGFLEDVLTTKAGTPLIAFKTGADLELEYTGDLTDQSDTNITSPVDGDLLQYNGSSSKWENKTLDEVLPTLDIVGDVDYSGIAQHNVMIRGSSSWENFPLLRQSSVDYTTTLPSDTR